MASLDVSINSTGNTTAELAGSFTGGASDYSYQRFIRVTIDGYGYFDVYSAEYSGGENTFSYSITGLSPATTYSWEARLYVRVTGGWSASDYIDSGAFTTESGGGGGGTVSNAYIYLDDWHNATPYIYLGSWKAAIGEIYLNGWR